MLYACSVCTKACSTAARRDATVLKMPFSVTQAAELDAQLQLAKAENVQLEAAKAELARQLAEAQGSGAELAAEKQALESNLAAIKTSLQASEGKAAVAEVSTSSKPVNPLLWACNHPRA